jgi:hypothetical protein
MLLEQIAEAARTHGRCRAQIVVGHLFVAVVLYVQQNSAPRCNRDLPSVAREAASNWNSV